MHSIARYGSCVPVGNVTHMFKIRNVLPFLIAAACSSGGGSGGSDPQAIAQELRENCVAGTLDLLQRVTDMVSPASTVTDFDQLARIAEDARCVMFGPSEGTYTFLCQSLLVRGESITLKLQLTFLDDAGLPTGDLANTDGLEVRIEAGGGILSSEGLVLILNDERGLVIDGFISTEYFDGCTLNADFKDLTGRTIADLPGLVSGVLFTSGEVDLGLQTAGGSTVTGTAGLVGRTAVVALRIDGVFSQGEIELGLQNAPE